jgi:cation:H+ antiporter
MLMNDILNILLGGGSQVGLAVAFLGAAACVVFAGIKLSAYGDALGERTGLGAGLVGLVFLAGVTSLPELVVSTTSALSASLEAGRAASPEARGACLTAGADLAVGNMLGSNVFNLMLIAFMDLLYRRGNLTRRLSQRHIVGAAGGLVMLGVVVFGMAVEKEHGILIPGLRVGLVTPVLPLAYLALLWLQGRMSRRTEEADEPPDQPPSDGALLRMTAARFYGALAGQALVIVLCGMWLSRLGGRMGLAWEQGGFGLGESFIGTFFLAVSTSLPELVICAAAVRMGFLNMAAGNVFGSNMFNLVILFTADTALRGGSLLHYAGPTHLVTVGMILMLTSIAVVSLMYQSRRSVGKVGLDAWLMLFLYAACNVIVYFMAR